MFFVYFFLLIGRHSFSFGFSFYIQNLFYSDAGGESNGMGDRLSGKYVSIGSRALEDIEVFTDEEEHVEYDAFIFFVDNVIFEFDGLSFASDEQVCFDNGNNERKLKTKSK